MRGRLQRDALPHGPESQHEHAQHLREAHASRTRSAQRPTRNTQIADQRIDDAAGADGFEARHDLRRDLAGAVVGRSGTRRDERPEDEGQQIEDGRRGEQTERPAQQAAIRSSREPRHREAEERVEQEDVAGPEQERVDGADREQDAAAAGGIAAPRPRRGGRAAGRSRCRTAARRSSRTCLDEDVLEPTRRRDRRGGRQRRGAAPATSGTWTEEHQHVGQQDAADGHAAQDVQGRDPSARRRGIVLSSGADRMLALIVTWMANSLAIYGVAYLMRSVDVASLARRVHRRRRPQSDQRDRQAGPRAPDAAADGAHARAVLLRRHRVLPVAGVARCPDFCRSGTFWATLFAAILVSLFSTLIVAHPAKAARRTSGRRRWSVRQSAQSVRRRRSCAASCCCRPSVDRAAPQGQWELVVLGIAQDAGIPHLGCTQALCVSRFATESAKPSECPASAWSIARSARRTSSTRRRTCRRRSHSLTGGTGPTAIFLTHAHIGHYTGLMYLGRESIDAKGVPCTARDRMTAFLRANGPWSQLVSARQHRPASCSCPTAPWISAMASASPRSPCRIATSSPTPSAFSSRARRAKALFIPDIDQWPKWIAPDPRRWPTRWTSRFLDGTFASADEIPGRSIADIPHPLMPVTRDAAPGRRGRASGSSTSITRTSEIDAPDVVQGRARFAHVDGTVRSTISNLTNGPLSDKALRPASLLDTGRSTWICCHDARDRTPEERRALGGSDALVRLTGYLCALARSRWRCLQLRRVQAVDAARAGTGAVEGEVRDRWRGRREEWLTYLASDALQGRQVFTEGYGLAAAYIAEHLRAVRREADRRRRTTSRPSSSASYRVTRNSSVTVEVGGETRTFKHGDHVTFADQLGRQADADVQRRRVRRLRHGRTSPPTTTISRAAT